MNNGTLQSERLGDRLSAYCGLFTSELNRDPFPNYFAEKGVRKKISARRTSNTEYRFQIGDLEAVGKYYTDGNARGYGILTIMNLGNENLDPEAAFNEFCRITEVIAK